MPRDDYEERRNARIDRLRERAEKAADDSEATLDHAKQMADVIPFGQPILVGHHSEGRDHRYRDRIQKAFRRGMELHGKAAELDRRADAAESNSAVSSDDPQAARKLREQLEGLEARQAQMKAINAAWRKAKKPEPDDAESWQRVAETLELTLDDLGQVRINFARRQKWSGVAPYESYELSNNNANIRRIRQRLEQLEQAAELETTDVDHGLVRVVENTELNRVQLFFPGKPDYETRQLLKRTHGFRWARSEGAWQRHLNNAGRAAAQAVVRWLTERATTNDGDNE